MLEWLQKLGRAVISNDWTRTLVFKWIRNALVGAGPVISYWLIQHGGNPDLVHQFLDEALGATMTGVGVAFSMVDAKSVKVQIRDAHNAGVQAAVDAASHKLTDDDVSKILADHLL